VATLTAAQVYQLAKDAGLSPAAATIATAISKAESGWRTDAMGDTTITTGTWGPSIGLWQIRSVKAQSGTGKSRDATRLTDPAFNARSMVEISGGGKNWTPWSVFTSGAYKKYLGTDTSGDGFLTGVGTGLGGVLGGVFGGNSDGAAKAGGEAGTAVANALPEWGATAAKLLVTGVAGALVIAGAIRTVSGGSA
jgi:hypothetical protein